MGLNAPTHAHAAKTCSCEFPPPLTTLQTIEAGRGLVTIPHTRLEILHGLQVTTKILASCTVFVANFTS